MQSPRGSKLKLLLALLLSFAAGAAEAQAGAGDLRAVYVHGDGLESPRVIHDLESFPHCFWSFTYHLYDPNVDQAPVTLDAPAVTFSFFTAEAWESQVNHANPLIAQLNKAMFHTRVLLTAMDRQPYVQVRKSPGMGRFSSRGRLPLASEHYLSSHRIPTRLDSQGRPLVRAFSSSERAQLREALPAGFSCATQLEQRGP